MTLIDRPSPNFGPRKSEEGRADPVDMLVIHYTGMRTGAEALARLCDPVAQVSAHYMIEEDGTVYRLVDESLRAWHAGVSSWRGWTDVNSRSVGVELVNPGHEFGLRPLPARQIDALTELARGILARHAIPARNVVGHSDIAPARKQDPGELFPWEDLAQRGVGLWCGEGAGIGGAREGVRELAVYGYDVADIEAAVAAFQRHFRPAGIDGRWDGECAARLSGLLARI